MGLDYHRTVLAREVREALQVKKDRWYLDATLGDGGHSLEILQAGGRIFGIDADPQALERAKTRFENEGIERERFVLQEGNFRDLDQLIEGRLKGNLEGAIFDLGVSTLQLMSADRGFSFALEGPLDMRMSPKLKVKASDLINVLNKGELYELFKNLAQDTNARHIAAVVASARPISTTSQLTKLVLKVSHRKFTKIHPATQVFQALRIAVNDELNAIREGLPKALEFLNNNASLLVISFHSLEDRIVKDLFRSWDQANLGQTITKKPIRPTPDEVLKNNRSRSASLRIFKKMTSKDL